ncbi:MAG: SusC/RagA family TonB-linked outer membrane protein [Odoribacter splanchnicus]
MKGRGLFLVGTLLLLSEVLFGQDRISVTGQVTEKETGESIIGATVVMKGETIGTTTDIDGFYTLENIPANATLVFSFVGLKTIEETVDGRRVIDVQMEEDSKLIDEVVIVGYGVQRKSDLTGAVASIKSDELQKTAVANVADALQGRVSGVMVLAKGAPGEEPEVKIRGIGTTNNSSPLYVVDGMFVNDLGFLNSHDIASMEVLKDASATAIYGSRGANGVIIVTTKQGNKGKPMLSVTGSEGFQVVSDRLKMADAEQYAQLLNEALVNSGGEPAYPHPELLGKGTDWFDEIFRVASVRDYQIGLNGGAENVSYNLSVGFFQQKGVIKRNGYHRLTLRANNEYRPWEKVKIGHNLSAAFSLKSNDDPSVVGQAYRLSPTIKPYNEEGDFSDSQNSSTGNPLATIAYLNNNTRDDRVTGNTYLTWEVIEGLSFRTSFGIDFLNRRERIFRPEFYVSSTQKNDQNELSKRWSRDFTWLWENTLTYDVTLKDIHRLNLLGGITAQERQYELLGGSGRELFSQDGNYLYLDQTAKSSRNAENNGYSESILSYLFRANYTLMDRYLFTFSFRADGSSKFGPDHRWGYFPSLAVGWRVTEENFLKGRFEWLDNLKIRGSWGQIGNDKIGNYKYYALVNIDPNYDAVFNGVYYNGGTITSLYNKSVHWERSEQYDLGFDLSVLNNRLSLEFDFYNRKTRDMLVTVSVPGSVGLSPVETNVGAVVNRGLDFTLTWQHTVRDFNYSLRFTGTTMRNRVGRLGGVQIPKGDIGNGRLISMTEEGKSIGYFYGYQVEGFFSPNKRSTGTMPGL